MDAHDLARRLQTAAADLPKAAGVGVVKAAAIMEGAVVAASGRYAGHRILRTKTTLVPPFGAEVKMASPKAHLLDHDTKAHDIGPRRASVLVIGGSPSGQPVAGIVRHPATKGKLIWEKALVAARPKMAEAVSETVGASISKALQ
jgi:hypothetical protein